MTPPRRNQGILWFALLEQESSCLQSSLKRSSGRGQNNFIQLLVINYLNLYEYNILSVPVPSGIFCSFCAFKAINLATSHHFPSQSYKSGECVKIGEIADGKRRMSSGGRFACRCGLQGPSSAGGFLELCLLKTAISPCRDSHPFLGELLLAVRKGIFLASLLLITLLPALSSMRPLHHWFLVGSAYVLSKHQIENRALFF